MVSKKGNMKQNLNAAQDRLVILGGQG